MVRSVTSCAEVTGAFGVCYEARGSFPFFGVFWVPSDGARILRHFSTI